jgi:Ran GTPase-activating protein (RanGAP) involved in mRNA processing and transport
MAALIAGAVALANALTENTTLRKLSVSDNYIGALGAGPLATALSRNSSITSLLMKGCELGDTVTTRLCTCLLVRCHQYIMHPT